MKQKKYRKPSPEKPLKMSRLIDVPEDPKIDRPKNVKFSKTYTEGFFLHPHSSTNHSQTHTTRKPLDAFSKTQSFSKRPLTSSKLINQGFLTCDKERLLISLKEELEYQKQREQVLLNYKDYTDNVTGYYLKNLQDGIDYKNKLNKELSEFIQQLQAYSNEEKKLRDEQRSLIETSEGIINMKKQEKEDLLSQSEKINKDLDKQNVQIESLRNKINNYREKNSKYFEDFEKNQNDNIKKYNKLNDDYRILCEKYKYLADYDNAKKLDDYLKEHDVQSDRINEENLKLEESKTRKNLLNNVIGDLLNKIKEVEEITLAAKKEEETIKFLGKTLARKLMAKEIKPN